MFVLALEEGSGGEDGRGIHCVPLTSSSDIWSFRLYGQFLAGPDFPILKIIGYMVKFRIYGQFYGELKPKTDGINAHI